MNSLFASNFNLAFKLPLKLFSPYVIYTEFAERCFSSLNYAHFISMFTFKRIICFWIIIQLSH